MPSFTLAQKRIKEAKWLTLVPTILLNTLARLAHAPMYIHVRIYRMSPNYCHVYNLKRNEIISTSNNLPSFNQNIRAYFSSKTSRIIPIRGYLRGQKTKHSSSKLRKRYLKLSQGSIRKLSHTLYIPCRKYLRIGSWARHISSRDHV